MKKTAVEFLLNELEKINLIGNDLEEKIQNYKDQKKYIIKKAKQLEKQQIIDAFEYGIGQGFIADNEKYEEIKIKFIEWYLEKNNNETYGEQLKSRQ